MADKVTLEKLYEKIDSLGNDMDAKISRLGNDVMGLRSDMNIQISSLRAENSMLEAKMYRALTGKSDFESPFKMEVIGKSLGNSATDPDYALFTDEDYGI